MKTFVALIAAFCMVQVEATQQEETWPKEVCVMALLDYLYLQVTEFPANINPSLEKETLPEEAKTSIESLLQDIANLEAELKDLVNHFDANAVMVSAANRLALIAETQSVVAQSVTDATLRQEIAKQLEKLSTVLTYITKC